MTGGAHDPSAILRARARELARTVTPSAPVSAMDVLEFGLGVERYAVERVYVREVYPLQDLALLPGMPPFLPGIVNVRGRLVAVLDLRRLFELPEQELVDHHQVVVLEGDELELGLLADVATGMTTVDPATLQPSLPTLTGIRARYLRGVTPEHLVVLDAGLILADPRIIVDHEAES